MSEFWEAIGALYLSDVRGYFRTQRILDRFRRQRVPDEVYASPRKLNLGSANRLLPTYINVDVLDEWHPDIVCDVARLQFARDGDFDLVRASHLLEHFSFAELSSVLGEWRRVLKVGGYLIVCVPDYRMLAWRAILRPSGYNLDGLTYSNGWINGLFGLGLPAEFRHKVVFTRKSITDLLMASGFNVIGRLHYTKEHPFTLGIMDQSCNPFSLNVAARKR